MKCQLKIEELGKIRFDTPILINLQFSEDKEQILCTSKEYGAFSIYRPPDIEDDFFEQLCNLLEYVVLLDFNIEKGTC